MAGASSLRSRVPINWAWFTRSFVLFQYSKLINGHQHAMESCTLDRASWMLEICDSATGQDQACSCAARISHVD